MTKKELINLSKGSLEFRDDENVIRLEDLHSFFESNVCIEKGDNRHPCAEVLHEWVEGEVMYDLLGKEMEHPSYWLNSEIYYTKAQKMAIPTYEWQWIFKEHGYYKTTHCYYVDTPKSSATQTDWKRLEESKRERK